MIRFLSMTVLLVFLATSAWANCKSREIKGAYVAYFTYPAGRKPRPIDICSLAFSAKGKVTSASAGCIDDKVTGGRLTLDKNCIVNGTIKTSGRNFIITLAAMEQGKGFFTGVFQQGNKGGSFIVVKLPGNLGPSVALAGYLGN